MFVCVFVVKFVSTYLNQVSIAHKHRRFSQCTALSSCSNTGSNRSIRDDSYWISRKNSLVLIDLSSINKVSLV